jgi:hypothetical protein
MSESHPPQETGRSSSEHVSWDEIVRRWSITCSLCRQPCASEDSKQLALGHVMHLSCYESWLKSQEDEARLKAKIRTIEDEGELRRRFRKWKRGQL